MVLTRELQDPHISPLIIEYSHHHLTSGHKSPAAYYSRPLNPCNYAYSPPHYPDTADLDSCRLDIDPRVPSDSEFVGAPR